MNFRSLLALVAIVSRTVSTLRRRLDGAPIQDDGRGLTVLLSNQAKDLSQIMGHRFETSGFDPSLRLLLHRIPWCQIIGYHAPGTSRPHHVAQGVEDGSHRVIALWRIFFHQREIRGAKRPLFIGNIAGISDPTTSVLELFCCHPKRNAWL